uniref:Uncharacterized protein n=1 Tax=Candidatus Kentrum sp. LFY TaxID=2126342 RepID=A0A450UQ23_9GAMM|nr:MAG: hypothetical protein BECKLFY1418B_GA0070995_106115 [Candidatus Kentron sp. LFY]
MSEAVDCQVTVGVSSNGADDGAHPGFHISPRRLCRFHVDVEGGVVSLPIEPFHEGQQAGGLAGLARGVEDEVALFVDESMDLVAVPTGQGGDVVILFWFYGPDGIEAFHGLCSFRKWIASNTFRPPENKRFFLEAK